jgi:hypothetical protein
LVAATIVGSGVWAPYNETIGTSSDLARVASSTPAIDLNSNQLALNGNVDWSKFHRSSSAPSVVPTLRPSQTALPRYVLDGRPVSYEASFSF